MSITTKIVADSKDQRGNRITTILCTFPRFILAELNTHRMFSRNSASSRAIPFETMLKSVEENPFVPIAWQKWHKGMQGNEYFTNPEDIQELEYYWRESAKEAAASAAGLAEKDVTKQLCNRMLEPFMYHTALITSTEWENFFDLRCPKYVNDNEDILTYYRSKNDLIVNNPQLSWAEMKNWSTTDWLKINSGQAEIHIMELAEQIWDAMNESKAEILGEGDWHIPFKEQITEEMFDEAHPLQFDSLGWREAMLLDFRIKVSTVICARTSYTLPLNELSEWTSKKYMVKHDELKDSKHASPFEHPARCMSEDEYKQFTLAQPRDWNKQPQLYFTETVAEGVCRNFRGFIQYRAVLGL